MISKFFWMLRGLFYKNFWGAFHFPSYIGKPIFIKGVRRVFVGKKVRIYPGSRIEVTDPKASIVFEDNISIGQNFHIASGGDLIIGKNTLIAECVMITNIDHSYHEIGKHIVDQSLIIKETKIGDNCFIGYGAVILAGTILGKQCIVGANSVVRGKFPDYCVIAGAPARIVKRYDIDSKEWKRAKANGEFIND